MHNDPTGKRLTGQPRPDLDDIPSDLKGQSRWVNWRYEGRGDKRTKVPYNPATGKRASTTDPETWASYDTACQRSADYDGIGFVLGGGFVGVDLDGCRDPETGEMTPQAQQIVDGLDSYTEISPSGKGIHVICLGALPPGGRKATGQGVELYDSGRYFTVTGNHLTGTATTIEKRAKQLAALHARIFTPPEEEAPAEQPERHSALSDEDVLAAMQRAKNWAAIEGLWTGEHSYASPSEATLALLDHLTFWCAGDRQQMDRLFRRSGLMREKWDSKRGNTTWGQQQIAKALAGRTEFYTPPAKDTKAEQPKESERLLRLAERHATEFFVDVYGEPFVQMPVGNHQEVWPVGPRQMQIKRWLTRLFRAIEGKPPSAQSMTDACLGIEAICAEGPTRELHNRVAWAEDRTVLYYDLTDDDYRVVKITAQGWQVTGDYPILFRRYQHQQPQMEPTRPADARKALQAIFQFLNVPDDEDTRLLVLVWLVSCFIPGIAHPILNLTGSQGSAKSYSFGVLRAIVDPSSTPTLAPPRDDDQLVLQLNNNWMALFDNISSFAQWRSDTFCRAITGAGYSKRKLFTDSDTITYHYRRVIGMNGVVNTAYSPDFLDRCLIINLDRLTGRWQSERELTEAFKQALPGILGACLEALVGALGVYPSIATPRDYRMTDFAQWGEAISVALGYERGQFLVAYKANLEELTWVALEGQAFTRAVIELVGVHEGTWQGTAERLLKQARSMATVTGISTEGKGWPGSAAWARKRLDQAEANLEDIGLHIQTGKKIGEDKIIRIWRGDADQPPNEQLTDSDEEAPDDGKIRIILPSNPEES